MIPKDFIQVPIERVQDLRVGDLVNGLEITSSSSYDRHFSYDEDRNNVPLPNAAWQRMLDNGATVYRKAEPVQEPIEFTVDGQGYLEVEDDEGDLVLWALPITWHDKTFREVTQDSVSRAVLTPEQLRNRYGNWWQELTASGDPARMTDVPFKAFKAGFTTGCSLSESSEVDLSAKDGSRDVHGGDGRIADALAYIDRQIAEWQDAKGSIVGPYNLDIDAAGTVAIEEFSTIADLLRQGSTRTELATPEPPKEESGSTQSCTQCSTQTEAPLGLIEELERLTLTVESGHSHALDIPATLRNIISRFKSKLSAEPVKGSATVSAEATPKGKFDKPEVAN